MDQLIDKLESHAKLKLSPEERQKFVKYLNTMKSRFSIIENLDLSNVEISSRPFETITTELRSDEVVYNNSNNIEKISKNFESGFYKLEKK